ncbi:MAG: protein phosphatase [Gemmobacter sp.]
MNFGPHELPVAGGMLALGPLPGRGGDLDGDLARLFAWRPDLVVSMTEAPEMAAADLPGRLAAAGIGWRHFPVADYAVPDAAATAAWPGLAGEIAVRLAAGGRVFLHCMGGCGRSGMVALALMVRAGEAPGPALARLRAVRPCAVETPAQAAWASDQAEAAGG